MRRSSQGSHSANDEHNSDITGWPLGKSCIIYIFYAICTWKNEMYFSYIICLIEYVVWRLLTSMHLFIVTEYATVGELFVRICNGRRFIGDETIRNDYIMLIYYFVYFSCFLCYGIIFLAIVIFYLMDNYCFFKFYFLCLIVTFI